MLKINNRKYNYSKISRILSILCTLLTNKYRYKTVNSTRNLAKAEGQTLDKTRNSLVVIGYYRLQHQSVFMNEMSLYLLMLINL